LNAERQAIAPGHPAFATEAIEPSLPTMTRAGQRCGCGEPLRLDAAPADGGNGVRKSRRPTATLAMAHVRQEVNLVGPAGVIGSRQVQVDDIRPIRNVLITKDSFTYCR